MTNPPDLTRPAMFPKAHVLIQAVMLSSAFFAFGEAEHLALDINEELTLEDVFTAGFRPSCLTYSEVCDTVRVWERQRIDLIFGDFIFTTNTEDVTFRIYDNDQIASLRITETREKPLKVAEASDRARLLMKGLGLNSDNLIDLWLQKTTERGFNAMQGFGAGEWRKGVTVRGEFLSTMLPADKAPTILAMEIRWKYLGDGNLGGRRN